MDKKGIIFLFIVALLFFTGLLMVFNTTSAEIIDKAAGRDVYYAFTRQLLYAAFGFLCAVGVCFAGYQTVLRLSAPLLIFFSILLVLVFIPGIGLQINGARRWINLFGNSFQPSEFVKYLIPLYFIHKITSYKGEMNLKAFLILMLTICIPMGLILVEPDNGTVLIIGITLIALCLLTRIRWTYWVLPLLLIGVLGGGVALKTQHVPDRIRVFMHPELDLLGKGHQPHQSKIAAGSGSFLGRGLGESLQKMNYLPEARSDYIAAIFAEEFGFLGISIMILLYMGMGFIGYFMALNCRNSSAFYLVSIFVFLICFQAFFNLGVVSGLLPSKGMNLPFFSQGGSSLLAQFLCIGIILSINKDSVKLYEKNI
jgi:cell division protein FtsW